MKKVFLTLVAVIFITLGYSQTQTMRVNLNKDTIVKKEMIDSVKKATVIKDAVIEQQSQAIETKTDSIVQQEKKISELEKATAKYFFGGKSIYFIFYGLVWVLLGVIFVWCMTALIGMKDKTNGTATTWSWKEFFKPSNVMKKVLSFIASSICAFAIMVFFDNLTHLALTMFYCFGIGLVLDLLIYWLFKWRKKFSVIDIDAEPKQPTTPKI